MKILLIEDDDVDVEGFLRLLRKEQIQLPVQIAGNGKEALQILEQAARSEPELAWLVITDIQMPLMNGLEFLHALRANAALHPIITFVLTNSSHPQDKLAAYQAHVAGYLIKADVQRNGSRLIDLLNAYQQLVLFPDRE